VPAPPGASATPHTPSSPAPSVAKQPGHGAGRHAVVPRGSGFAPVATTAALIAPQSGTPTVHTRTGSTAGAPSAPVQPAPSAPAAPSTVVTSTGGGLQLRTGGAGGHDAAIADSFVDPALLVHAAAGSGRTSLPGSPSLPFDVTPD
jgi:hypothetical protein